MTATGIPALAAPTLAEITAARDRIADTVIRTPLLPLDESGDIQLKLENLQPIGSFKLRGPLNAMRSLGREALREGVYTASAGNHGQGVAWAAREMNVPCTVFVPEHAPATKVEGMQRLGATIIKLPLDSWWRIIQEHHHAGTPGRFIHPAADQQVIEANATIGLEIMEDLPSVAGVLVPYGGGGLSCGISAALRARGSRARVYAVEPETATPLTASFAAGSAQTVQRTPSFVDGMGGKSVLPEMYALARAMIAGVVVVSLDEIAAAIRILAERAHVVAEGAGAAGLAAAIKHRLPPGMKVVCIVSGGNIDAQVLGQILRGETPRS